MSRERTKQGTCEAWSTDAVHRGGISRSSDEVSVMEMEPRGYIVQLIGFIN
jgi:RNA-directed DNA polymerase